MAVPRAAAARATATSPSGCTAWTPVGEISTGKEISWPMTFVAGPVFGREAGDVGGEAELAVGGDVVLEGEAPLGAGDQRAVDGLGQAFLGPPLRLGHRLEPLVCHCVRLSSTVVSGSRGATRLRPGDSNGWVRRGDVPGGRRWRRPVAARRGSRGPYHWRMTTTISSRARRFGCIAAVLGRWRGPAPTATDERRGWVLAGARPRCAARGRVVVRADRRDVIARVGRVGAGRSTGSSSRRRAATRRAGPAPAGGGEDRLRRVGRADTR